MKFSAAAVLAVAAGVSAFENVTYTTEVVTAVTTFCPAATVLTHAGSTYTITEVSLRREWRGNGTWLGTGGTVLGEGCGRERLTTHPAYEPP
jgi:hypothetical protein